MKIVPKLLNFEQKQRRMDIAQEMLTTSNDDLDLLKKVITGDEWCMAMALKPKPNHPKGKRCATIEEIKEKSKQELLALPKSAFQKYFEDWNKRWHKCNISKGGYFEGNKIVIDK